MADRLDTTAGIDAVGVTIPAKPEYVSIARLAVAAVAARQAFTYDEIEDLRIAVSEACTAVIGSRTGAGPPIALRFVPEEGALAVWIESAGAAEIDPARSLAAAPAEEGALGLFLMQCLVDDVRRIDDGAGRISLRLTKKRQEGTNLGAAPPA